MISPRYLAEHLILPRFLREQGGVMALDAIKERNADFFIPVWMEAGFQFTPRMVHTANQGYRLGLITLPAPREDTEAYFAAIVGNESNPLDWGYFVLESSTSIDGSARTVIGEWSDGRHLNFGSGPPFTGALEDDAVAFIEAVLEICLRRGSAGFVDAPNETPA
ncbi:MAG TPA: hypothetical protein VFV72_14715 [Candidatus Limnocylindrales bacterium]|nr:hypothetical protein [Candidatus Limnocylindrales bacterium]